MDCASPAGKALSMGSGDAGCLGPSSDDIGCTALSRPVVATELLGRGQEVRQRVLVP